MGISFCGAGGDNSLIQTMRRRSNTFESSLLILFSTVALTP